METSFDVRVYAIDVYTGKTKTTHWVQWQVAGKRHKRKHTTAALAESFRSKLLSAARDGDAFGVESGLPLPMLRTKNTVVMTWHQAACGFVDVRWREASPGDRKTTADSLIPITVAMLKIERGAPSGDVLRAALRRAFNPNLRNAVHSAEIADALEWAVTHSRDIAELEKPDVLRSVLAAIDTKLDGTRAAANTVRLRRIALRGVIEHGIEKKVLSGDPLKDVKTKKKVVATLREVDRRSVVNPLQGRMLLAEVEAISPRLTAFFALMYYAAHRPEEAANLRKDNLALPLQGWGDINLEQATPEIGSQWTDSGQRSEARALKHREDGVGRPVPCCPELTAILWRHIETYGTASDGRLFYGARNSGRVGSSVYGRVWAKAREAVFVPEVVASPLVKRPYDLRHACVSTWLAAGVEPTRVAAWAGHSVAVLLKVYAKFLDGGEQDARAKVERMLKPLEPRHE
jgi:integrase